MCYLCKISFNRWKYRKQQLTRMLWLSQWGEGISDLGEPLGVASVWVIFGGMTSLRSLLLISAWSVIIDGRTPIAYKYLYTVIYCVMVKEWASVIRRGLCFLNCCGYRVWSLFYTSTLILSFPQPFNWSTSCPILVSHHQHHWVFTFHDLLRSVTLASSIHDISASPASVISPIFTVGLKLQLSLNLPTQKVLLTLLLANRIIIINITLK